MTDKAVVLTVESVRTRASTSEALITFALPLEQAANVSRFMGMIGQQVGAAFVDIKDARQAPVKKGRSPTGDYGIQAQTLRQSGFMRSPAIWKAIGTDEVFLNWIRHQACAYCGKQDYVGMDKGEMKCEAAHVRKVKFGAGTSIKPEYAAIPLCRTHHRQQHNEGESCLGDEDWWNKQRVNFVSQWAWEELKTILGYDSWKEVPPDVLRSWAEDHGLEQALPVCYLETDDD